MDDTNRYRGLVRTSLTSGAILSALATATLAVGLATGLVPDSIFGVRELITVAIRGFGAGAVAGGIFSWFVVHRERGQTLSTLSTRRVALWGGLAAASVPLLASITSPVIPIETLAAATALFGIGGSATSAGLLRLARRGQQPLIESDAKADRLLR